MADTTTPTYALILPEVGASQDTWGSKYNTNTASIDTILANMQAAKANLAGPAFSGNATFVAATFTGAVTFSTGSTLDLTAATTVTAPTPPVNDNSTKVATTAWVTTASTSLIPPGAIMPFAFSTPPTGWLECNGASLLRTTWPALFAKIGGTWGAVDGTHFTLPDFRGMFLRGWDHGAARDLGTTSRGFATFQEHANQDHLHAASASTSIAGVGDHAHTVFTNIINTAGSAGVTSYLGAGASTAISTTSAAGAHSHTATTTVSIAGQDRNNNPESHPRNFAILYCIKT